MKEALSGRMRGILLPEWDALPDFGLYMDQVMTYLTRCFSGLGRSELAGLTPAMINNYVKNGLVNRPQGKKYGRDSLAQMLMICVLKQTMSLQDLSKLLHPADGAETGALYTIFREEQQRLTEALCSRETPDALTCALEAASRQILCSLLLEDAAGEG